MKFFLKYAVIGVLSVGLSACAALERTDIPGTQIAENAAYGTEVITLNQTGVLEQATHAAEVNLLGTQAAEVNGVNTQLLGTLQAVVTPTIAIVQDDSIDFSSMAADDQERRLYVETGVTDALDDNGCVTTRMTEFNPGVGRIYATLIAYNLVADTVMSVEWYRGEELMLSDSWIPTENSAEICVWFDLDSSRVDLLPGQWEVTFYVNRFPLINKLPFTINGG